MTTTRHVARAVASTALLLEELLPLLSARQPELALDLMSRLTDTITTATEIAELQKLSNSIRREALCTRIERLVSS